MRYRKSIVALIVVGLMAVGLPASALTEPGPCLGYELDVASFSDVADDSPHRADIECISGWDITVNTGTYDPSAEVTRWQMALFLIRTLSLVQTLPEERSQGFTDIVSLPADQRAAINQLAQLSVTTGTSATTYDPNAPVTRWQMALFLSRLFNAAAVPLPVAADQGFTDVGHLSVEARAAINGLKAMGVTTGTSATTFSPDLTVSREQMASFLARTLAATWYFDPIFEAETDNCDTSDNCTGSGFYWTNLAFTLRAGWFSEFPYPDGGQEFLSAGTKVDILVDGVLVVATELQTSLAGVVYRTWSVDYPQGLSGPHTIQYVYSWNGEVVVTETFSFTFDF